MVTDAAAGKKERYKSYRSRSREVCTRKSDVRHRILPEQTAVFPLLCEAVGFSAETYAVQREFLFREGGKFHRSSIGADSCPMGKEQIQPFGMEIFGERREAHAVGGAVMLADTGSAAVTLVEMQL